MSGTVLANARVVSPGRPAIERGHVRIEGERIVAVGDGDPPVRGDRLIDCEGRTVMPGLIDSHLHILGIGEYDFAKWALEEASLHAARGVADMGALADAGFTTVRDAGSDVSIALKRAQAQGSVRGPRVWASGRWISVTGNLPDIPELPLCCMHDRGMGIQVDGPDSCRRAVRQQVRAGADMIKIATTGGIDPTFLVAESPMAVVELEAIMESAHGLGRRVTAHNNVLPGQRPTGIRHAVQAGIDAIDHGYHLDDEVIELMAEHQTFWIITCSYLRLVSERGADVGLSDIYLSKARMALEAVFDSIPRARAAGVPIAIGSDLLGTVVDPHGLNAMELTIAREAGFSDAEVLELATAANARCLGIDSWTGTVEEGKVADLIVVDGRPDEDIAVLTDTARIRSVLVAGREVKADTGGRT